MNRRNFLVGLFAIPAAVKALTSAKPEVKPNIIRPSDFPYDGPRVWVATDDLGCSLTRATFKPLSPQDFAMLAQGDAEDEKINAVFARVYAARGKTSKCP